MNDHREDPLDEVIEAFRQSPVPDRPDDEALMARLVHMSGRPGPGSSLSSHPFWRFLMLPSVRYASAAAILLVVGWLALSPSPTPALAEVIEAAEQHKLVRFQSRQTTDDRETHLTGSGTMTVYIDMVVPRLREEEHRMTFNEILDFHYKAVYDYRQDRFLAVTSHEQVMTKDQVDTKDKAQDELQKQLIDMVEGRGLAKKKAFLSRISGTKTDDIPPMSMLGKDRGFLDGLRELQANENTLDTRAELDGREVAKFRLREGNRTTSLWVDPRTKLPVRVEIEVIDPTPRIARNEWVYTDFEWDPEVADLAGLFSTEPPAGYALEDHRDEP